MPETAHEKSLKKIEAETLETKKQIMRLEFQSKKDIVADNERMDERDKRGEEWDRKFKEKVDYIAKLAGITYEKLDNLDLKIQNAGRSLVQPRKYSTLV